LAPTTGRWTIDHHRRDDARASSRAVGSAISAGASCPSRSSLPARSSRSAFADAWGDPAFRSRLDGLLRHYGGRPTPVTECGRLSERLGIRLLLKREDLAHTGSHKLNNVIGQALLAERMGKRRLIAETGAGQHGVATATAAALLGLECLVYMGAVDVERQGLNVFRMELLGAEVRPVHSGKPDVEGRHQRGPAGVGRQRRDDALLHRLGHGPAPVPFIVRELQRVVGEEARVQCHDYLGGFDPDVVVACVGGGSNAAGTFAGFVDTGARLVGVEAAGGAAMSNGVPGAVHGMLVAVPAGRDGSDPGGELDLRRVGLPGRRP
jgi:tryptophan synthase beta chain